MPNHVHLLITPRIPVPKITQSLKRFTAQEANRILGLTGKLWQPESYDRLVRSHTEFHRIANYIEMNPVKAGLAIEPEDYPWSSAGPIKNRPQVANLPHRKSSYSLGAGFASKIFFKISSCVNLSDSAWKFSKILCLKIGRISS